MPLDHHEPREQLPQTVLDQHRAIESLIEELEAVQWYHERAAVTGDGSLRAVLLHNRNEEIEHAMMNLEWLRRNWPEFDENMRTFLFTSAPIEQVEEAETSAEGGGGEGAAKAADRAGGGTANAGSLNIGSMKKGGQRNA